MKKPITFCLALLLVLSLFSGCISTKPGMSTPDSGQGETTASASPDSTPSEAVGETAGTIPNIVAIETEAYEYTSDYIDVKLEVPQLTGLADGAVQDSVNAVFSDIMTVTKNGIKPAEDESKGLAEEYGTTIPYMTYLSYSVPYNKDGILSILVSNYLYLGGAHGNDLRSAYTFDLRTGEQLSFEGLMTGDSEWRAPINKSIRAEIDNRAQTDGLLEYAEFEDVGAAPAYYLTHDAIVFYFQEYEYFPYAAGIQEFFIKYAELSDLLKEEYASLMTVPVTLENTADNTLTIGDIGQVVLSGNPTTGYSWNYTISDGSILEPAGEQHQYDAADAAGAGGMFIWNFRALKAGTATITLKYYRSWIGESDAAPEDNITYTMIVK